MANDQTTHSTKKSRIVKTVNVIETCQRALVKGYVFTLSS